VRRYPLGRPGRLLFNSKEASDWPSGDGFPSILDAARTGVPWAFERLYADLAPVVAGYLRVQGALPEREAMKAAVA
jgi:hypothetical protein